MACNCIKTVNEKLQPQGVELKTLITFGDGAMAEKLALPLVTRSDHQKKRGERLPQNMTFAHCPFCGLRYEPEGA
ncbi:hypothetical protein [Methylopila sp. M107]|uniref:hypothetical protein n=1 Tax=Methylopila sp. M107 TaxID=1101190 RepID=UPI0003789255|nr:hypothetical protein [Methylopila sp. M107]